MASWATFWERQAQAPFRIAWHYFLSSHISHMFILFYSFQWMNNSVCLSLNFKKIFVCRAITERRWLWDRLFILLWHNRSHFGPWKCSSDSWYFFQCFLTSAPFHILPSPIDLLQNHRKTTAVFIEQGLKEWKELFPWRMFKGGKISFLLSTYEQILRGLGNETYYFLLGKYFHMVKK